MNQTNELKFGFKKQNKKKNPLYNIRFFFSLFKIIIIIIILKVSTK